MDYNEKRTHQPRDNLPLTVVMPPDVKDAVCSTQKTICDQRLGGLLKHYDYKAAYGRE